MIIPAKYYRDNGYFIGLFSLLGDLIFYRWYRKKNKIDWDLVRLEEQTKFPRLILDENHENSCDSCQKCSLACPTQALNIVGEEGMRPKTFDLKLASCISCKICIDICPSEALVQGDLPSGIEISRNQILNRKMLSLNLQKAVENLNL